jgi:hypothetical protein
MTDSNLFPSCGRVACGSNLPHRPHTGPLRPGDRIVARPGDKTAGAWTYGHPHGQILTIVHGAIVDVKLDDGGEHRTTVRNLTRERLWDPDPVEHKPARHRDQLTPAAGGKPLQIGGGL